MALHPDVVTSVTLIDFLCNIDLKAARNYIAYMTKLMFLMHNCTCTCAPVLKVLLDRLQNYKTLFKVGVGFLSCVPNWNLLCDEVLS